MNQPESAPQMSVDAFNRELDRVLRGGAASGNNMSPEDARAFQLAQNLGNVDMSGSSALRQSLRHRFSERSSRYPTRLTSLYRLFLFREGRSLAGLGLAVLLAFLVFFGLLSPQHASATPTYNLLPVSASMPDHPAVSLTVAASHYHDFYPRPVPTPLAMYASSGQSSTLPERTPVLTDLPLGSQFPVITTTTSK